MCKKVLIESARVDAQDHLVVCRATEHLASSKQGVDMANRCFVKEESFVPWKTNLQSAVTD